MNIKENRVGVGVVARDDNGVVLLAASKTLWPFVSVERAEIDAFQWGVEIVKEQHWSRVVLEGDTLNAVHTLQGKLSRGIHNLVIINNIHAAVRALHDISFSFRFREANFVAHRLAKWASASVCSSFWYDSGPTWISDIVLSDLAT